MNQEQTSSQRRLRKNLRVAGLVLLAASLAVNAVLLRMTDKLRQEGAEVRLDPLGYSFFPVGGDPSLAPSTRRVVFFGDSRAQNWVFPKDLAGYQFVNRGIGHQTTTQVLERFEEHVAELKPQIIVLQVGVNDLKQIDLFPERKAAIVATTERNIDTIVSRCRSVGATVVLTTVFPIGNMPFYRRPFWHTEVQSAIGEVNDHIRAQKHDHVVIFDTVPLITDAQGVTKSDLSLDFLHLNDAGYAALNKGLSPVLAEVSSERAGQ